MAEELVLDTAIRDWVLMPLSVVMVLIGILHYFVAKLLRPSQIPDAKVVKEGQVVVRTRNLRAYANLIPPKTSVLAGCTTVTRNYKDVVASPEVFRHLICQENGLLFVPKGQAQNAQAQIFSNPNMALDMMKKKLSMIIPRTLTFTWVNLFFSGFVAGHRISLVEVKRKTSLESEAYSVLFLEKKMICVPSDDTQRMMQTRGFGFDPTRSLGDENDVLDIVQHDWVQPKFEQRAEALLRRLVR